jgi:glycosyltransferase involved in cell wall biosynthesis
MNRLAVVVTTYNRPDALARVLSAWAAQPDSDIELLVADDGSASETRAVLEKHYPRRPAKSLAEIGSDLTAAIERATAKLGE